jgi:hypothetical protein
MQNTRTKAISRYRLFLAFWIVVGFMVALGTAYPESALPDLSTYIKGCQSGCGAQEDPQSQAFCQQYCQCTADRIQKAMPQAVAEPWFSAVVQGQSPPPSVAHRLNMISDTCLNQTLMVPAFPEPSKQVK